jgi:hypothetical protein
MQLSKALGFCCAIMLGVQLLFLMSCTEEARSPAKHQEQHSTIPYQAGQVSKHEETGEALKTSHLDLLLFGTFLMAFILVGTLYRQNRRLRNIEHLLVRKQQETTESMHLLTVNAPFEATQEPQAPGAQYSDKQMDVELNLYNNRILTELDWELFKQQFDRLYPGYILRVRGKFPELSHGEERLFLLIKANLNASEMAQILGITVNAVKKSRQRLRKRLYLMPEDDLDAMIQSF